MKKSGHTGAAYDRHAHQSYATSTNAARKRDERERTTTEPMKANPNNIYKLFISKRDVREKSVIDSSVLVREARKLLVLRFATLENVHAEAQAVQ